VKAAILRNERLAYPFKELTTDTEAALTDSYKQYRFFTIAILINKTTLKTMASDNSKRTKFYFACMCAYWLIFGLIKNSAS
jgi:hypothetical protein